MLRVSDRSAMFLSFNPPVMSPVTSHQVTSSLLFDLAVICSDEVCVVNEIRSEMMSQDLMCFIMTHSLKWLLQTGSILL